MRACGFYFCFLFFLQGQPKIFETGIILHFPHIMRNVFPSLNQIVKSYRNVFWLKLRTKWFCFHRKMINGSDKYIKFNEIENRIFLDALLKSVACWDRKQEIFYMALAGMIKWCKNVKFGQFQSSLFLFLASPLYT